MSVLITGVDMPKSCVECIFDVWGGCLINLNIEPKNKLTHSCPLIELPDHGDLIDREETAHEMWMKECYECNRVYDNNGCKGCAVTRMINVIACAETAPAVIPAERSEDGET